MKLKIKSRERAKILIDFNGLILKSIKTLY